MPAELATFAGGDSLSPSANGADSLPDAAFDAILVEQQRDWTAGRRTPIAEWLRRFPALAGDAMRVAELAYHEFVLRQGLGESPDWEDYLRQFPASAGDLSCFRRAEQVVEQALPAGDVPAPVPVQLDDYEVLEEVGHGGMGVVLKARQRSLDRVVALKWLRAGATAGEEGRQRFRREALAVARLQHPNIVPIYGTGEADGQPFLALEFVAGGSLAGRLAQRGGTLLPARAAASLVELLARAVEYAHQNGIIHRDLKPANVLLAGPPDAPHEQWGPKLTDFGLAKRLGAENDTRSGAVMGTPSYMAPEQAGGSADGIGPWTDVYGLGAILYELLTGQPPFRAEDPLQTLQQVAGPDPVRPCSLLNPAAPRDVETICLKCLDKASRRRYASAAALADDLGRWLRGEPVRARRIGSFGRAARWARRRPVVAGLIAALVLTVAGAFAGITHQWLKAEAARRQDDEDRREAEASDVQAQLMLGEILQPGHGLTDQRDYFRELPHLDVLLKAEARLDRQLDKTPGDIRLRVTLTKLRGSLATLYGLPGRINEMEAALEAARGLWEPLARDDPGNPEYRDWLATVLTWQANAASRRGQRIRCYRLTLETIAIWQELAENAPDDVDLWHNLNHGYGALLTVHDPGSLGKELLALLEGERARLGQLADAAPDNTAFRKRLALTYLALGELHQGMGSPREAALSWHEAYDHYKRLAEARADDPPTRTHLALCCTRLMGGRPADPHYAEAVALYEEAGRRLESASVRHPENEALRLYLLDTYCALALCHWKAGRSAPAEQTYQERVRPLATRASDSSWGIRALGRLLFLAFPLEKVNRPASLRLAREAAALAELCADAPSRDQASAEQIAENCANIAGLLGRLGAAQESLRQAELSLRLYAGLRRAEPDVAYYGSGLSSAWERVGKARWGLGRRDEALAAFRSSAEEQRKVVEQAPSIDLDRVRLRRCYDRLVLWGGRCGDRATVAAALIDREKLGPNSAKDLMDESRQFRQLADAVGRGRKSLSPDEEAERQRYLAESERTRRAAEEQGK